MKERMGMRNGGERIMEIIGKACSKQRTPCSNGKREKLKNALVTEWPTQKTTKIINV